MFEFNGYKIRPATKEDLDLAAKFVEGCDDHRGRVAPEFFVTQQGCACFVMEDETGPIFFFRTERVMRLHIQFGPATTRDEKHRNAVALIEGFAWLCQAALKAGYQEIISETPSKELAKFSKERFGFQESPNELVCGIVPPQPNQGVENPARVERETVQTRG